MGSVRTWSLALVAGIFVVVVAHQRSHADAGLGGTGAAPAATPPAVTSAPAAARVTGLPDFSGLVAENGAAVVNISVVQKAPKMGLPGAPGEDDPLSQFFHHYQMPPPGHAPPMKGIGSGFIVSPDGYILTNSHVVDDSSEVTVKLTDRREFIAKVIGVDKRSDVALIKIAATGLPTVHFGDSSRLRPGQWVVAIGSPFGFENSVTAGVISGLHREIPGSAAQSRALVDLIQTDAPISPGNSGGALLDTRGQVIGINDAYIPPEAGAVSLGFAIPSATAIDVADQMLATGKVVHPVLGVSLGQLTASIRQQLGVQVDSGALVLGVDPGSPAAAAGIQPGDVIIQFGGKPVAGVEDVLGALRTTKPGDQVVLTVARHADRTQLKVTVGTQG